jgi:hypothetical protein
MELISPVENGLERAGPVSCFQPGLYYPGNPLQTFAVNAFILKCENYCAANIFE